MRLKLNVRVPVFCTIQLSIVGMLLLLSLIIYLHRAWVGGDPFGLSGLALLLDIGLERNLPTGFSVLNLLLSAALCLVMYASQRRSGSPGRRYWLFLATVFVYLAADEGLVLHERYFRKLLRYTGLDIQGVTAMWIPVALTLVLIVTLILLPFLRRLPRDTATLFVTSGFLFVLGAVGFEHIGFWMKASGLVAKGDLLYDLRRVVEEGLEMFGIVLFNCVIWRELARNEVSLLISGSARSHP